MAPPGGTVASASDWLAALPVGTPASSRIEEPSAVMKDVAVFEPGGLHGRQS